ncbi:uncharacterized protein LOC132019891 [Mustela nigripes]|uniref:uncharacterized protein LOC132019891 n=1 Tax=Mustela nigripes TaxID=77151 RepID=UPI002815478B|nr:uncharacterized protein LOC132019891 [Mustela nigripes]
MWGAVTQQPMRALRLGTRVGARHLHRLTEGLWALLLGLVLPLRVLLVCVREGVRAVLSAASSVVLTARVCTVYTCLQGMAWIARLVGGSVALHLWLCSVLLETLRCIPLLPLCAQAARWLVRTGVCAGRVLAQVRGVAALVQLCAHALFLGACLCLHICFAAISSKVRVRVHAPVPISLPFRVRAPLSLGVKGRLPGQRRDRAQGEVGIPQGEIWEEQEPQMPRSPQPTGRREVSQSRSELSPGG